MVTDLVEYIVKQLVDNPQLVLVREKPDSGPKTIIEVRVAHPDLKRIIGKEGRVVRAIRALVNSIDSRDNIEINLDSTQ